MRRISLRMLAMPVMLWVSLISATVYGQEFQLQSHAEFSEKTSAHMEFSRCKGRWVLPSLGIEGEASNVEAYIGAGRVLLDSKPLTVVGLLAVARDAVHGPAFRPNISIEYHLSKKVGGEAEVYSYFGAGKPRFVLETLTLSRNFRTLKLGAGLSAERADERVLMPYSSFSFGRKLETELRFGGTARGLQGQLRLSLSWVSSKNTGSSD